MLNQRLLQGGSLGTFHILPSLTRSLEKLHHVIDQEMYAIGAQKLVMPCLAPKHLWDSSGNNNKCCLLFWSTSIIACCICVYLTSGW